MFCFGQGLLNCPFTGRYFGACRLVSGQRSCSRQVGVCIAHPPSSLLRRCLCTAIYSPLSAINSIAADTAGETRDGHLIRVQVGDVLLSVEGVSVAGKSALETMRLMVLCPSSTAPAHLLLVVCAGRGCSQEIVVADERPFSKLYAGVCEWQCELHSTSSFNGQGPQHLLPSWSQVSSAHVWQGRKKGGTI